MTVEEVGREEQRMIEITVSGETEEGPVEFIFTPQQATKLHEDLGKALHCTKCRCFQAGALEALA